MFSSLQQRRENYLTILHHVTVVTILFFSFKYNYEYKISQYNSVIFTLLAVMVIAYQVHRRSRSHYFITASVVFLLGILSVGFFVYTAGGMAAPGIFWLSIFPLVGGIILGPIGNYIGSAAIFACYLLFIYLGKQNMLPDFIEKMGMYESEKIQNLFIFSFVSLIISNNFISNERKAQKLLEKKTQETDMLLRLLMHDVASPVMVIRNATKMIEKKGGVTEDTRKYYDMITNCTGSVINLLKQIRDMSAVNDGKIEMDMAPYNLHEQIDMALKLHEYRAEAKDIKFKINLCSSSPIVMLDAELFKMSIFSNIVSNAIKFSPVGANIEISTIAEGDRVMIAVRDFGIGIPEDILKNLFSLDKKTTRAGTSGEKGTGYGMVIMRAFIEKFQGQIEVRSIEQNRATSENPSGTTITLILPVHKKDSSKMILAA